MRSKRVKEKYDSLAHYYDKRWEGYLRATHEVAIELLEPKADDIILDASGGTGLLIERIIHITGDKGTFHLTDISTEMLDKAKLRFKENENVIISQQDVHHLEFDDNYFSKVLCVSSFHYYAEPHKVLANFHRVLKPNGVLILMDWCRDSFHFMLFNTLMKLLSRHHVNIYSSNELKSLIEISNFKVDKVVNFTHGLWRLVGIRARRI
ncbi:MAG: methyltransferase domain-containing protein [Thermodesulfobacteriota bacterium]